MRKFIYIYSLAVAILAIGSVAAADDQHSVFQMKAVDVFERALDFMVTLSIALFALVGVAVKDFFGSAEIGPRKFPHILVSLFFLSSAASFFFAYRSRLDIARQLLEGRFDYTAFDTYAYQALALIISSIFAAVIIIRSARNKS